MKRVDPAEARAEAASVLAALGFAPSESGETFTGTLDELRDVPIAVGLPAGFPYELPLVCVARGRLPRRVPHIEKSGKVCIAATAGLMVDPTQPGQLVREALTRARDALIAGLRAENPDEFTLEFGAYWSNVDTEILSFCRLDGESRTISIGEAEGDSIHTVIADTKRQLETIGLRLGLKWKSVEVGYFVRLPSAVPPPDFDEVTTVSTISSWLHMLDGEAARSVARWTVGRQRQPVFVFCFSAAEGEVAYAARLRTSLPSSLPGFRSGHLLLGAALRRHASDPVDRIAIQRADAEFLSRRTGSNRNLTSKRALVVGCGAIGGYLAVNLADAGIGQLTLVDKDRFRSENAMRHVLGISSVGRDKVAALADHIQSKLPSVGVEPIKESIQALLKRQPSLCAEHDIVFLATGDHAVELALSEQLRRQARLVHVWTEAHGVGGHVLVDGHTATGCLGCLFEHDDEVGLWCRAALCAPGQTFTSSIVGCAGTFTPFGALDAQRAAIEATRLGLRVLEVERDTPSVLVSWLESGDAFHEGVIPSDRARHLVEGQRVEVGAHAGCDRCA